MEKNYEIIVYGATGFTGKICCKYLKDKYADLNWGIAGRNGEKLEQVKADLGLDCDVLIADGFDDAIIGIAERYGMNPVVLYDKHKCIKIMQDRDGMTEEEAIEFFYYNIVGAYM